MKKSNISISSAAIIGGGPAGLMAAEVLSQHGVQVELYDAMPSVGRKFLMAGKSGLNLTHAEALDCFLSCYGERRPELESIIKNFTPEALQAWAHRLGIETFVGSSGKVFPAEMKAAPLLRAWLHRLRETGVRFHMRHRWLGFTENHGLRFMTPDGEKVVTARATLLALGGGSWARLGSTGAWVPILSQAGVDVLPLRPSNCGFDVNWSEHLRERFAGEPVKSVTMTFTDVTEQTQHRQGDFVITQHGIEGSLVYALSAAIRDMIERDGRAVVYIDMLAAMSEAQLSEKLTKSRGRRSMSEHLRRQAGISGVKSALLREVIPADVFANPVKLAALIKALPLTCERPRPIDEAISTAGGVSFAALDESLMLKQLPGIFCAGEMLDWDAPTGGYLLTACFASGYVAGQGLLKWCQQGT